MRILEARDAEIKLQNERKATAYKEAKSDGYDPKIMRVVLRIQKNGENMHHEDQALIESYLDELS